MVNNYNIFYICPKLFSYRSLFYPDSLRQWERNRKQQAERTILTAAKIISPRIASTFSDGYAWCVEAIKQSVYSSLAIELEINKAADLLKLGDVDAATEALIAFNNKESKVGSAAANNLALINFYVNF
uniref:Uncharacterized protein n=1 Tax=Panagrolaimus superbus TaxID=310955 RepID=A0A914YAF3_9BILA